MVRCARLNIGAGRSRRGSSGRTRTLPRLKLFLLLASGLGLLFLGTAVPVNAQLYADTVWVRTYNGPADLADMGVEIWITPGGQIIAAASTGDGEAAMSWTYTGDTAWTYYTLGPGFRAVAPDAQGGCALLGRMFNDYATVKIDSLGNQEWWAMYNGPGSYTDEPWGITCNDSGYVGVTGEAYINSTIGWKATTVRYSPAGDTVWARYFEGAQGARAIASDHTGNLYVGAGSFLVKYLTTGDTAWTTQYPFGSADKFVAAQDGSIFALGSVNSPSDVLILKYSPSGDTIWTAIYDGPSMLQDTPRDIAMDGDGQVYVTLMEELPGVSNRGITTIKYTASGDTAWVRTYDGDTLGWDNPYGIAVGVDGAVYVTGETHGDIVTLKYDSSGNAVWAALYDGVGSGADGGRAIAVDDTGTVFVTGYTTNALGGQDCIAICYREVSQTIPYGLEFYLFSPVDMVVTDPLGDSIGIDFNTILAGSDYDVDTDFNSDGDPDDIVTIPAPLVGDYAVRIIREPGVPDSAKFTLSIRIDGNTMLYPEDYQVQPVSALGTTIPDTYVYTTATTLCGDCNANGSITSADIIYLVTYVFKGGSPPVVPGHGDVNCNGAVTSSDIIYLVTYVFKGGDPPCSHSVGD